MDIENLFEYNGQYYLVNANKSGILPTMMRVIIDQLKQAIHTHSKVFIFRFDLHSRSYETTNETITTVLKSLVKSLKRHYNTQHIQYLWCREQERAKQQHYHIYLIMDGKRVRHPNKIQDVINRLCILYDLSPHWSGYHYFKCNEKNKFDDALRHVSYLAKKRGKGYKPRQTKNYGHSRVKCYN